MAKARVILFLLKFSLIAKVITYFIKLEYFYGEKGNYYYLCRSITYKPD